MKLRDPRLLRLAGVLGAGLVRLWVGSLRHRYHHAAGSYIPADVRDGRRYVYAFWHEAILLPAYLYGTADVTVLISQHADGELIAGIAERLGYRTVRGSSTRGGVAAVKRIAAMGAGHVAVTPDGPRGPRRVVQPGIAFLASRAGMPVVPLGVAYDRPWRAGSWDRFALPKPLSRCCVVMAEPVAVPAGLDKPGLEHYRNVIQAEMDRLTAEAEWRVRRP